MRNALRLSSPNFRYFAWALDLALISVVGQIVYSAYLGAEVGWFSWPTIYTDLMIGVGLGFAVFGESLYRSWRVTELRLLLKTTAIVWVIIFVALAFGLFLTKSAIEVSRVWFVLWVICCWVALTIERLLVYMGLRWLRRKGYNYRTVLLIGRGPISEEVKQTIFESAWGGLKIVGQIDASDLEDHLKTYRHKHPNEVWICIPMSNEKEIKGVLHALRHSLSDIRLVPDLFSLKLINHGVSHVMGIPMLDLSISPVSGGLRLAKGFEDKFLALIILLFVSPLMCLISLGVWLTSPGPIFFVQRRWGWNGKEINIYKFRTMFVHQETNGNLTQASVDDARITSFGACLRRTSLDELPQFINVLQGRMSIVGPRPHAVEHNEHYKDLVPRYMLRHKVKPGITGWAQVNGYRGETDTLEKMQKRIEFDLFYIENMSIIFDIRIILETILKGFTSKTAY